MDRFFLAAAAILGALGVAAGAFGAHGLKDRIAPEMLDVYETGARYHLIHAVALGLVAWACARFPGWWAVSSGWYLIGGVVVFSGTLYLLAVTGERWLGALTPLGGLSLIVGWLCLLMAALGGGKP